MGLNRISRAPTFLHYIILMSLLFSHTITNSVVVSRIKIQLHKFKIYYQVLPRPLRYAISFVSEVAYCKCVLELGDQFISLKSAGVTSIGGRGQAIGAGYCYISFSDF